MTRIEDLLRAATRETAAEISPESIPLLDPDTLPLPRRPMLRFGGPLTPLLAAAAVVLAAALSVTLSTVVAAPRPPAGSGGPGIAGVPPYYVALTTTKAQTGFAEYPVDLTVRSTFTGKVLATVAAPRPYGTFNLVDGTADDRTFLVGAQMWHSPYIGGAAQIPEPVRLFLLHYDPSTGQARLSALPLPQFNGLNLQTASISPDGTRLAVAYQDGPRATWLHVYTLPGGAESTWTPTRAQEGPSDIGFGRDNPASIAWAANDRTFSFVWNGKTAVGVHLFNTGARVGNDLLSASRFVLTASPYLGGTPANNSDFICDSNPFLSANGAYVLCGGYTDPKRKSHGYYPTYPSGPVTQGFGEFSAKTGKLITILGARRAPVLTVRAVPPDKFAANVITFPYLLWASPDAKILIGEVGGHAFVVHDGHKQTIPLSSHISVPDGADAPGVAW